MMSRDIKLIACPDFFGMVEQKVWFSNAALSFSEGEG